jgi:hypothetical protein
MEETQVKVFVYRRDLGEFANTRNRTKDRIKNRMNNIMKRSNHTKCHRVHIQLYFILQQVWWHLEDLYSLICQWTLHFLFRPIFRSVFYMSLPTINLHWICQQMTRVLVYIQCFYASNIPLRSDICLRVFGEYIQ